MFYKSDLPVFSKKVKHKNKRHFSGEFRSPVFPAAIVAYTKNRVKIKTQYIKGDSL